MRIIINTAHQRFGGAIQVALSFIYESQNIPEHDYYVWVGPGVRKSLIEEDYPPNFHFQHFDFGVIGLKSTLLINRTLQKAEKIIQPDCIISTSGPTYFHSQAPQIIGYNLGLYLYQESPFMHSRGLYSKVRMAIKRELHHYYFKRDAEAFVVQTNDVNQRVRKALNTDEVYTVTNTHSSFYNDWESFPLKLPSRKKGVFRFITISSYYGHKNLELIPLVLEELKQRGRDNVEFVLTLPSEDFQDNIGGDQGGNIHNVGPIKPPECPSLYAECDALFLPTLAECFSASYPEAMVMGLPIITTDLGFARSICDDAALYFEAQNAKAAADAIESLLDNPSLRQHLISKGRQQLQNFDTPIQRAQKYLKLCEKYADK